MSLRIELLFGYLLQLLSVTLLLAQHFLLPVFLGMEGYGVFAFIVGCASLLSIWYDHGLNLLTVRKPSLAHYYLAYKIVLLVIAACGYLVYALVAQKSMSGFVLPVFLQGLSFILYTHLVNYGIACGRIRKIFAYSIVNGGLLVAIPVAFSISGLPVMYSPALATSLSFAVIATMHAQEMKAIALGVVGTFMRRPRFNHVFQSLQKQFQISFGTVVDGTIVWLGVVVIATSHGFEASAGFRIVMSAIALMTQTIPLPKQVLLKASRKAIAIGWEYRFLALLVGISALQIMVLLMIGRAVVDYLYPEMGDVIYGGIILLAPVGALRAIFELETILADRTNSLPSLVRNGVPAALSAAAGIFMLNVYWGILIFYAVLTALSATPLFRIQRRRASHPDESAP